MVSVMAVELSCGDMTVREIKEALRQLPDGNSRVTRPPGPGSLSRAAPSRWPAMSGT